MIAPLPAGWEPQLLTVTGVEVRLGDRIVGLRSVIDSITYSIGTATFWADRCPLKTVGYYNETVQVLRGTK